uniref:Uncharacterized protein n=1 Tax=Lepeophtheirus salmonis TaxID=72036 RepID=A0A0K2V2V6_LEPSM
MPPIQMFLTFSITINFLFGITVVIKRVKGFEMNIED